MAETLRHISGRLVDVHARRIVPSVVRIADDRIIAIDPASEPCETYLLPGFVDSHIHIESSMLPPREFARLASVHGTVATVSDPHEIANVLGKAGVEYMLAEAERSPLRLCLGAPACVPVTPFETAGGTLSAADVESLLADERVGFLSEVCNYPAVLKGEEETMSKIAAARKRGKPVDGHAPGLRGPEAARYADAGITTDHECMDLDEARGKTALGMVVQIREGSAARNFAALEPLIDQAPRWVMFCSDDKHPDDLLAGHINVLVRRAVADGLDLFHVLRCASVNPVRHYGLNVGLLRVGDRADFIEVADLEGFEVLRTVLGGSVVARNGRCCLPFTRARAVNRFAAQPVKAGDFALPDRGGKVRVIEAIDGQLATNQRTERPTVRDGQAVADPARDLLLIAVVNRYAPARPGLGFIRGFGLQRGAIASSVAHDSHNLIAVGCDAESLAAAVNGVIGQRGGLAVCDGANVDVLGLPIAGLMSDRPGREVAEAYQRLSGKVRQLGSPLGAAFMTLSFMGLLVIPQLKLSDRGLFDGERFEPVDLWA